MKRGSGKVHPLAGNQLSAVAPARTVWLSASAGTGKTQVLSARVLRLLLEPGVDPEHLLCLTFTKAGAAEMATRVNEVLASWVRLDDVNLAIDLGHIGAPYDRATLARARSRFAAVLDCPGGGLRIETIHAFAQWLLSAFPEEAGLRPGTRAMEDRDRDLLLREVLADILVTAEREGDHALLDALAMLSLRLEQRVIEQFLLRCAAAETLWLGADAWEPLFGARIRRMLGIEDMGGEGIAAHFTDAAFDCRSLRRCLDAMLAWNTKTAMTMVETIADWLAGSPAGRAASLETMARALLTEKGEPKHRANLVKQDSEYEVYAARVIESIERARDALALEALAALLEPALTLGHRFAHAWIAAKAREGFIDFDDQIRAAARLLTERAPAEWIRFKLDRRFDHVLVDEAQDTNAAQWRIVLDGLVGEFFSGEGQRGGGEHDGPPRTLFVVGDYKQAIFRFQGTSPDNFDRARRRVKAILDGLTEASGDPLHGLVDLGLARSYRTARPILEFVDRAIECIGHARFGLEVMPDPHEGEERPGLVTLWPVAIPEDESEEPAQDDEAGRDNWLSRPDRALAERLALQVRSWLETGFPLIKGRHRHANPGDIMILVRRRKDLAGLIVSRLHAAGVPVAGVDRLRLGAPLGIKDLLSALRFAAQPFDDLNLAGLLVSPLMGWNQDELLARAYRPRGVRLWDHLRHHEGPEISATLDRLRALLARADYDSPASLLQWLLVGPWQGRLALAARIGAEVNDPIDELVNAALAYSTSHAASLVGFLRWFDAGDGEIKREAGKNEGLVRVMTVHGAKGLQAPIVILADAADDPTKSPAREHELADTDAAGRQRMVPVPPPRKAEQAGPLRTAAARVTQEEREEHWRLLYVAMTRAEEALFITGSLSARSKGEAPPESWYAGLAPLFEDRPAIADPIWTRRFEIGAGAPHPRAMATAEEERPSAVPALLRLPIGPEPRPPRPLAPSSLGEDEAPDPPARAGPRARTAARRGTLVHKLIERLPEIDPDARRAAALRWIEREGAQFAAVERDAMVEAALGVIDHPDWQDVFGPGSLAEVPIAALVGTRMISGKIDRLLIMPDRIRLIDFKTDRIPPEGLDAIPRAYVRQMAAYVAALGVIHPDRTIEAALLYTQEPRLFALSGDLLATAKLDDLVAEESFSA